MDFQLWTGFNKTLSPVALNKTTLVSRPLQEDAAPGAALIGSLIVVTTDAFIYGLSKRSNKISADKSSDPLKDGTLDKLKQGLHCVLDVATVASCLIIGSFISIALSHGTGATDSAVNYFTNHVFSINVLTAVVSIVDALTRMFSLCVSLDSRWIISFKMTASGATFRLWSIALLLNVTVIAGLWIYAHAPNVDGEPWSRLICPDLCPSTKAGDVDWLFDNAKVHTIPAVLSLLVVCSKLCSDAFNDKFSHADLLDWWFLVAAYWFVPIAYFLHSDWAHAYGIYSNKNANHVRVGMLWAIALIGGSLLILVSARWLLTQCLCNSKKLQLGVPTKAKMHRTHFIFSV